MTAVDATMIRKVLDEFAAAYASRNVDAVIRCFVREPDMVMVGTGADEIRIGPDQLREQIERDLSQAERLELQLGEIHVSGRDDVAWTFAQPVVTAMVDGEQVRMPLRMTLVLVHDQGQWLVHSGHLSAALAAQQPGQSYAEV